MHAGVGPTANPLLGGAFCIDLFHPIYVGLNSFYVPNQQYLVAALTTDSWGNPLTKLQKQEIGGLAKFGFGLITANAADLQAKLAGVQVAIWTIEYPATAFSIDPLNPLPILTGYAAQYVALAPTLHGHPFVINSDKPGGAQNLVVNFSGSTLGVVPELATWLEMVARLGFVGLVSRRRRSTMVAA